MRAAGIQPRQALTPVGEVRFCRTLYECPGCRRSQAPLDAEMGLRRGERIIQTLVRRIAWSAAQHGFADASANVAEMIGVEVSPAECHRVALQMGGQFDAHQRAQEAERLRPVAPDHPAPKPEFQAKRLVIQADAGSVLTRADEDHKMVWCGRAFAVEDRGRQPGQKGEPGRAFLARSRHTASADTLEDFGPRLKALAYRMGMRSTQATAFVADGATCLWKWAEQNLPPGTVLIQDFWHVAEHLAGLARDLWGNSAKAADRSKQWRHALWESRVEEVLVELRAEHKRRRGARRERLEREIHYLEAGRERMDYARFRAEDWPIGSGAIEADCKHLVKERFGLSGARWRRKNIAPILALRLAIFNEEWNAMWSRN